MCKQEDLSLDRWQALNFNGLVRSFVTECKEGHDKLKGSLETQKWFVGDAPADVQAAEEAQRLCETLQATLEQIKAIVESQA